MWLRREERQERRTKTQCEGSFGPRCLDTAQFLSLPVLPSKHAIRRGSGVPAFETRSLSAKDPKQNGGAAKREQRGKEKSSRTDAQMDVGGKASSYS